MNSEIVRTASARRSAARDTRVVTGERTRRRRDPYSSIAVSQSPWTSTINRASLRATALAADGLPVSFGWAAAPEDGVGSLELFRKADDRLYAAKLIARNHRVVERLAAARH